MERKIIKQFKFQDKMQGKVKKLGEGGVSLHKMRAFLKSIFKSKSNNCPTKADQLL